MKTGLLFLVFAMLSGCAATDKAAELQQQGMNAVQQTTAAVDQIKNDALNAKKQVEQKIDQVNTAVTKVQEAKKAVDAAIGK